MNLCLGFIYLCICGAGLQNKMCLLLWVMVKNSHCFCPQGIETQGAYLNAFFLAIEF